MVRLDSETTEVRQAISGYELTEGSRGEGTDTNPGGDYTGEYNDDGKFTGAGVLDECNGMTIDGQYGYDVTDTFPWVIRCLRGTPNDSFSAAEGGEGGDGPPVSEDGYPKPRYLLDGRASSGHRFFQFNQRSPGR